MDLIDVSRKIELGIKELGELRKRLESFNRSNHMAQYEKEVAKTIIKLRNGVELEVDGQRIVNPPVTIVERIAKGVCWKERMALDQSEAEYKAILESIDIVKAQLNAYQSINKNLSHL